MGESASLWGVGGLTLTVRYSLTPGASYRLGPALRGGPRALVLALVCLSASAQVGLASTLAPEATVLPGSYAPDRVMIQFRADPSKTELEAFQARQFLELLDYFGTGYPPGEGWYLFRIADAMDPVIVRDLLRAEDPWVCNAELVALGVRHAIKWPPDPTGPLPCVPLPSAGAMVGVVPSLAASPRVAPPSVPDELSTIDPTAAPPVAGPGGAGSSSPLPFALTLVGLSAAAIALLGGLWLRRRTPVSKGPLPAAKRSSKR